MGSGGNQHVRGNKKVHITSYFPFGNLIIALAQPVSYCKSPDRQLCLGACLLCEKCFPSLPTSVLHRLICKTYETGNLFPSFCSMSTCCKHPVKYAVIIEAAGLRIFFKYGMQILLLFLIEGMLDLT